uniref:Transmembrane protein n=1 Tax=Noctiluca scintillans TaxID=2966 RepID=A0A6T9D7S7_NOCSC
MIRVLCTLFFSVALATDSAKVAADTVPKETAGKVKDSTEQFATKKTMASGMSPSGGTSPIITAEKVADTVRLLGDVTLALWHDHVGPVVEKLFASVPPEIKDAAFVRVATVNDAWARGQLALSRAIAPSCAVLDKVAAEAVDKFEDMLPKYKGLVPRTFSDVTTFIVFFCIVLYVLFRMFRFGLGLMCCVFCPCFFCRKRKKLQAVPGGKSEKRKNRQNAKRE